VDDWGVESNGNVFELEVDSKGDDEELGVDGNDVELGWGDVVPKGEVDCCLDAKGENDPFVLSD
jgi:hypothetical protein